MTGVINSELVSQILLEAGVDDMNFGVLLEHLELQSAWESSAIIKYKSDNAENIDPHSGKQASGLKRRSPLPVGYPRIPLQDITDILNAMNSRQEVQVKKSSKTDATTSRRTMKEVPEINSFHMSDRHFAGSSSNVKKGIHSSCKPVTRGRASTASKSIMSFR